MSDSRYSHTSGRRLARNAVWNFVGMATPLLVGIIAIPLLIDGMGKERFGLLAIIWMAVGYFSLFDMGLARALTKLIAERLGEGEFKELGKIIWTAFAFIIFLGILGLVALLFSADTLIQNVFNVDLWLQYEAISAFKILAIGLPVVTLTSAVIGILEAHQRFGSIAAVRIPLGALTFAAPLVTLQFTPSLVWATIALLFARFVAAIVYYILAASFCRDIIRPQFPDRSHMKSLFHFGGWLTVSNIIGPIMVYFDRFFIGMVLTMTAVTYYVTPYEVISRARLIPQSMMGVLFPALTISMQKNKHQLSYLYGQSTEILLHIMLPVTAIFFLFAPEALGYWLGPEFTEKSSTVVQWLAVGLLVNTLTRPSFTMLQSAGRPDLIAKTHLVEVIPYILLLWYLTSIFGITGTAAAWFIRVFVDAIILNELARFKVPEISNFTKRTYRYGLAIILFFILTADIESLFIRSVILVTIVSYSIMRLWLIFNKKTDATYSKGVMHRLRSNISN